MKKLILLGIAIVTMLSILLGGCQSGPPKPPVGKLTDLDKLVTENMTLNQVHELLKPELKENSTLYQATGLEVTAAGAWKVTSEQYGYPEGEIGPYQVLFFTPDKSGEDYYLIFFKDYVVIGKDWFAPKLAAVFKSILQGLYNQ
jgi:hypothetical protein